MRIDVEGDHARTPGQKPTCRRVTDPTGRPGDKNTSVAGIGISRFTYYLLRRPKQIGSVASVRVAVPAASNGLHVLKHFDALPEAVADFP